MKWSMMAGVPMAMLEMIYEGLWGVGFWAPPALIAGVVFPAMAELTPPIGFLLVPFIVGLIVHKITGAVFSVILEQGYRITGLTDKTTRLVLGGVYGLGIFFVTWFILLPFVNPAMLMLNPFVFAGTHVIFGLILGKVVK